MHVCVCCHGNEQAKNEHSAVLDKEVESVVMELQEELISVRLKEAESAETLRVLNGKIDNLEKVYTQRDEKQI